MASLRNALPRRTHRERSQVAARAHLGLLEKKKDYVERARDFQRKTEKIKNLRKKARDRNPDEFYFGMVNQRTKGGVHEARRNDGADKLSHDEILLMKSQDLGYLSMKKAVDDHKVERLMGGLHLLTDKPINKHKIFLDKPEDVDGFDAAEHFDTVPELAGRAFNRPRQAAFDAVEDDSPATTPFITSMSAKQYKKIMKEKEKAYEELADRVERSEKLRKLIQRKQVEKQVMGKGRKRKIESGSPNAPPVYKWKRKRAR